MAKQTNKTNHILNLLSGNARKKENEDGQNSNSSVPPVVPKNRQTAEKNHMETYEENSDYTEDTGEVTEHEADGKARGAVVDVVDKKETEKINESLVNNINSALEEELKKFEEPVEEPDIASVFPADEEVTGGFGLTDEDKGTEDSLSAEPYKENPEEILQGESEPAENRSSEIETEAEALENKIPEIEAAEEEPTGEETGQPEERDDHEEPADAGFITLNVMEELVDMKVMEYINKFSICTCERCVADVRALALTGLPGKYVVVDKEAVTPMLHFYEQKFNAQVVVELTKACVTVGAKPHH